MGKILFLLLMTSCAAFQTKVRTEQSLSRVDDLVVSNSQTNPFGAQIEGQRVNLDYKILIKNVGDKSVEINTAKSKLKINEEIRDLKCTGHKQLNPPFKLEPGTYLALTCYAAFSPNNKNKIAIRDTDAELIIPLYGTRILNYKYRLFIEDFE